MLRGSSGCTKTSGFAQELVPSEAKLAISRLLSPLLTTRTRDPHLHLPRTRSLVSAGGDCVEPHATLGSMVRVHKSGGRKSSACPRKQPAQTEVEDDSLHSDSLHLPKARAESCSQTNQQPENCAPKETPTDVQERADSPSQQQVKPLWKPIPPLLPEPHRTSQPSGTRDQSCQTDAQPPQTSAWNQNNTALCGEPGDPPLLQQPLHTSKSGIQQIIDCFRSGTSQLKLMLLREVDTIFECKLCRSLFRGLPNLITHKEYYCLSRLPDSDGDDRQSVAIKDLLDAIYPRGDQADYVMRLEPIQTTTKAVFQYITTEEELARYPSHAPSARESPVAWEGEPGGTVEGLESSQANQPAGTESLSSPANNQGGKRWEAEEEAKQEKPQPEEEESNSGVEDVTISCCLCNQDFNSRRSIRRHCRKMHQTKLEELRKFTETRTVPTSLLSVVKVGGRPKTLSTPTGKSCPVCLKTFATKANVRRHFDEVHQGLRRDITPGGTPIKVEATPPKKTSNASPARSSNSKSAPVTSKSTPSNQNQTKTQSQPPAAPPANASSYRCTLCKRTYTSQLMLKRHMRIVHKIYSSKNNKSSAPPAPAAPAASAVNNGTKNSTPAANSVKVKEETMEPPEEDAADRSAAPRPIDHAATAKGTPAAHIAVKMEEEETPATPKIPASSSSLSHRSGNASSSGSPAKMIKLSVGFDFKELFCKLCKRQFSSRQNLTKHIELHTDGNDIFIKFYRCPLCRYESRRKRDVLRHVTVVHKKSSPYLAKIMPKLESRAVKRLAEAVLNTPPATNKRTTVKEEVNGRHISSSPSSSPSPPVTRKQDSSTPATTGSSASSSSSAPPPAPVTRKQQELSSPPATSSPPVTRKQDRQQHHPRPLSPPQTRRSEKQSQPRHSSSSSSSSSSCSSSSNQTPHSRKQEAETSPASTSTEVRVTKNFSLHACDQCGRAFAKKVYLESHKRSHRNASPATSNRRKGVSTRSKSLVW